MASGRVKALKQLLRLASAAVGLLLLVLSCAGFRHVDASGATLESRSTFGCLCFLGVCFGLLLALAEAQREGFFFFFGFLRYRVGRAAVFGIAGVMMTVVGKSLTDQCDCATYVLLVIEGAACMAIAVLHTLAICALGNNTKPAGQKSAPAASDGGFRLPGLPTAASKPIRPPPPTVTDGEPAFTPVVQPATLSPAQPLTAAHRQGDDPNLPAWMRS